MLGTRRTAIGLAALVVAGLLLAQPDLAPVAGSGMARAADCVDGWARTTETRALSLQDVLALPGDRAIAVGSERRAFGDRRWAVSRWDGTSWQTMLGPRGADGSLLGVAGDAPDHLWAVGFRTRHKRAMPIALRLTDARWVVDSPPRPASGAQVLSAVDVAPDGDVWAVGMAVDARPSRSALVWQRTAGGWKRHLRLPVGRRTALSGVLARTSSDVWAVGSAVGERGIRPLILHWNGQRWNAQRIATGDDEASLSGIAAAPDGSVWAVGSARVAGALRPLVLHLVAGAWVDVGGPDLGGALSLGTDVSLDGQGRPWVVGTVYRLATDDYVPVAARLDRAGWTVWPQPPGSGLYLDAVSGDLATDGWASGRAAVGTLRVRACEPVSGTASLRALARAAQRRAATTTPVGRVTPDEGARGDRLPRPVRGLTRVVALPRPTALPGIAAHDDAKLAGIDLTALTHGAVVADLDGDGRRDLFISGHGGPAIILLRRDGGYVRQPTLLPHADRHDCDVLKADAGPKLDLICSVGGERGLGIKANELWMNPTDGTAVDEAAARGVADPFGRGRDLAVFDADGDGDPDIFLGNLGLRFDGQPTPNRLMLNDGTGHFTWSPDSGLTSDRGSWCAVPMDVDLDGDKDLLLCGQTGDVLDVAKVALYRNDGTGHFTDVTAASGIRPIGEVSARMGRLGGDDRPDLVQLSVDRIRISLWRGGRYVKVYERKVDHGRALAVGDVNGDGMDDIYLQLGSFTTNLPDLVLVNDGTGRRWTPMAVPSTSKGTAESVVPLDWDGNGLTDFLVLNGSTTGGPIQLISFTRTGATTGR